jgi:HEPN domain-containing protein
MDTIILTPRKKSDIDSVLEFARSRDIPAATVSEDIMEDLEALEDAYISARIEEGRNTERVSRDRIFALLDR